MTISLIRGNVFPIMLNVVLTISLTVAQKSPDCKMLMLTALQMSDKKCLVAQFWESLFLNISLTVAQKLPDCKMQMLTALQTSDKKCLVAQLWESLLEGKGNLM